MAVSKWKIAKYLFPLIVLIGVGLVSKSWSPQVIVGEASIIQSNQDFKPEKPNDCIEKWQYLFPNDSIISKITEREIWNPDRDVKPFDQNERLLSFLPRNENNILIQGPLMGVFDINGISPAVVDIGGIYGNSGSIRNTPDVQFLVDSKDFSGENLEYGKITNYPNVLNSLSPNEPIELSVHTSSYSYTSELSHMAYLTEACDDLIYYVFNTKTNKQTKDPILIAATLSIKIEFNSFPEVDKKFQNYLPKENCMDCPISLERMKSFGRLEGFDNLYFFSTDDLTSQERLNEPARGLVYMEEGKTPRFIWYHGVDLFGCACL
ncbi:MAG: hypothetical protein ACSHWW_04625 [Nonlabens sp.]|uniref:hypothetical protein n=1 Tax=Nonlabens sp. TaxID=1888209 RepID=UPI003EF9E373